MKVLEINATIGTGSVGRIVEDIHNLLVEKGHTCKIAYGRGKNNRLPESNSIKIGKSRDVLYHIIMARLTDKAGFYSKNATKKLIKKIKEYSPDIIHMHGNYGYYINIEILFEFLSKINIPVVNTLHSCWDFTGHCCYFDYIKCNKWKTNCFDCPQKKTYPESLIFDKSDWNYKKKKELLNSIKTMRIVTPSQWMANLVEESFLKKYPIQVIPNGIDLKIFQPTQSCFREKNNLEKKWVILGVANKWSERKGLDVFIKLAMDLPNEYQVVIVGVNKQQKKALPPNVIAIERTNDTRELAEIYTAADAFINPTYEDNFPTTNLESLACGTPVITYETGGSPECITKDCGVVIDKGNYRELYNTIVKLDYKKISNNDCINQSKKYDKNIQFIRYLNLFEDMYNL